VIADWRCDVCCKARKHGYTSAVPAPVPYANLTNPQTLNLYSMVGDDPESFADLDGHCTPQTP